MSSKRARLHSPEKARWAKPPSPFGAPKPPSGNNPTSNPSFENNIGFNTAFAGPNTAAASFESKFSFGDNNGTAGDNGGATTIPLRKKKEGPNASSASTPKFPFVNNGAAGPPAASFGLGFNAATTTTSSTFSSGDNNGTATTKGTATPSTFSFGNNNGTATPSTFPFGNDNGTATMNGAATPSTFSFGGGDNGTAAAAPATASTTSTLSFGGGDNGTAAPATTSTFSSGGGNNGTAAPATTSTFSFGGGNNGTAAPATTSTFSFGGGNNGTAGTTAPAPVPATAAPSELSTVVGVFMDKIALLNEQSMEKMVKLNEQNNQHHLATIESAQKFFSQESDKVHKQSESARKFFSQEAAATRNHSSRLLDSAYKHQSESHRKLVELSTQRLNRYSQVQRDTPAGRNLFGCDDGDANDSDQKPAATGDKKPSADDSDQKPAASGDKKRSVDGGDDGGGGGDDGGVKPPPGGFPITVSIGAECEKCKTKWENYGLFCHHHMGQFDKLTAEE